MPDISPEDMPEDFDLCKQVCALTLEHSDDPIGLLTSAMASVYATIFMHDKDGSQDLRKMMMLSVAMLAKVASMDSVEEIVDAFVANGTVGDPGNAAKPDTVN